MASRKSGPKTGSKVVKGMHRLTGAKHILRSQSPGKKMSSGMRPKSSMINC